MTVTGYNHLNAEQFECMYNYPKYILLFWKIKETCFKKSSFPLIFITKRLN